MLFRRELEFASVFSPAIYRLGRYMTQSAFNLRTVVRASIATSALFLGSHAIAQLPEKVGNTPVPSLAPIIKKPAPAVVNIATKGTIKEQANPLLQDPFFRRFFGEE